MFKQFLSNCDVCAYIFNIFTYRYPYGNDYKSGPLSVISHTAIMVEN